MINNSFIEIYVDNISIKLLKNKKLNLFSPSVIIEQFKYLVGRHLTVQLTSTIKFNCYNSS